MITAKQLVEFVKKALAEGWGYVYGGQGETYTRELAENWGKAKRSGKTLHYFVTQCARWFDRVVVDCSGLLVEAFRSVMGKAAYYDRAANTFKAQFTESGPIKSMPDIPGLAVWRNQHIGIHIGGGKIIEARGYQYGVVLTEVSKRDFTHWGKLRDVDYTDVAGLAPVTVFARLLKRKTIMMRGDDVMALQELLAGAGCSPGKIDGIFGDKTKAAVIAYQKAKKLKVDGIVGAKTAAALGAQWNGK